MRESPQVLNNAVIGHLVLSVRLWQTLGAQSGLNTRLCASRVLFWFHRIDRSKVNTIERVVDILRGFPEIPYEFREDAIRVLKRSDNGYEVALLIQPQGYTVCLATWHMEFGDEYHAIGTFFNGLTDQYRLEVFSRGNVDYRWRVQYREFNGWINGSIVGIFSYPFWKTKRVRYLQNDWLSLSHMSDIAKRV